MADPINPQQEIVHLTAEAERLRKERDAYRGEVDELKAKGDATVSAQLRLLSADLTKGVQGEFFSLLKWVGGLVVLALTVATAGGFFTFSNMIASAVEKEIKDRVKEKDEDIKSLRTNMIQAVVDFKAEANKALSDIKVKSGEVTEATEKFKREIAVRYVEGQNPPASTVSVEPSVTPLPPGMLTIRVVVHVVYRTPEENISDEQIKSQIAVLNDDYQAKNADLSKVPAPFKDFVGNARIQFALAGITRTKTTRANFGSDAALKSRATGGNDPWDAERYLNIWVATLADGLLEYSQFPGGPKATDGVVVANVAFGTTGSAKPPFSKGRGATHSIGHYLNLRHIWGDTTDCSGSDFVADTPTQKEANFGKPTFPHITCNNGPNGDMFMNFMDYVDDDAMYMFTKGQVLRMHETLQGVRKQLLQP